MHRRDGKLIVAATDLVGFLECGHLTNLDMAAADNLIRKPDRGDDPEIALLQRRGAMHEQRYIEMLEKEDKRQVTDLSGISDEAYEDKAARTIAAMRAGADVIYQGMVFDGRWIGFPDFLLRVPLSAQPRSTDVSRSVGYSGETGLGIDWIYEVADTKLAHSAKASALIQICSYVDQITRIQGTTPKNVYVVTGGETAKNHEFRTAEMMAYYRLAKARFEDAIDETKPGVPRWPIHMDVSYPDPVEHCGVCRYFYEYCRQQWRTDDALPLVAGITRTQRKDLAAVDIRTRTGLATATKLDPKLERVHHQARVQVASDGLDKPVYELLDLELDDDGALVPDRGLSALPPPSAGDLFFDIEGDAFADWVGLEYLFGVWEPGLGGDGLWDRGQWHSFWALDQPAEKKAFEEAIDLFIGRLDADPNMHIYHYAPYEPSALKRLAARHGTREDEVDRLLRGRVLIDLYRVVRQGLRIGVESYSIKRLEDLYGYTREVDLRDANSSIVEFESYLDIWRKEGRREQKILDTIEEYNRDDCVSAQRLRDWLEERRPEAAEKFGRELPRPPAIAPEVAAQIKPKDAEVRALEHELTADLPAVAEQTPSQHGQWLLAQLLDWHNRERKSGWWRFFELMTLSPEELLKEKESIGALVYEGVAGTAKNGRLIHRYRFPPQEHDVGDRSDLHDPAKPAFDGSEVGPFSIDGTASTLEIRRVPDWNGTHPLAVVPNNMVYSDAQEAELMRIGRWVAVNGIDSEDLMYRAARDLLRRLPPRVDQTAGEVLVRTDEGDTGKKAATRLALAMDGTTLAIQGPPGTGKTYTGARMILELIKKNHKVGITSNSHKVIGNLLTAVCDAAAEVNFPLRPMQKGDKDEVITHPKFEVKRAPDNKDVIAALDGDEVDVVGGTPWLWAREDMERKVHTIFVDEAGQVSLANVVALSTGATNVVLLGDPQQLDQPIQGVHPEGADRSALAHLLTEGGETAHVIDPRMGVFFEETWRMHPDITRYTSDLFYRGELHALEGLEQQRVLGEGEFIGAGIRWVPIKHDGNTDSSVEEADEVARIWKLLVGRRWVDRHGDERLIGDKGVVIVSPFNAHRKLIIDRLPSAARVGTVDKFQGQQAPVSIYTMACSRPEDAPRGMGFLYNLHRLNVATSRAKALAIVVASHELLKAVPRTPEQLHMVNGLAAFVEAARSVADPR